MGFGAYYVIIGLSMKAGLAESCTRLALGIKIPQVKLSSVYVVLLRYQAHLPHVNLILPCVCRCFCQGSVDLNKDLHFVVYIYYYAKKIYSVWVNTTVKQVSVLTPLV